MSRVPCRQPGCAGAIEDGYCNLCGMAPTVTTPPPPAAPPTAAPPTVGPAAAAAPGSVRASARSATTHSTGTRRTASKRGTTTTRTRLGAGLVEIPPMVVPDPATVILAHPDVAEDKRFCAHCGEAVGRGHGGRPGRPEGFCGKCRHPFSFSPKLVAAETVGGQYEVAGALAHGGLGWIYLAKDRHVSNRWVVLKGLLDSGDADALAAALAEARFLATVEHPKIVRIYNFLQHHGAGYTVMEYVGGPSLKELLKVRRAAGEGPLPVTQAIAYMLEILPALGYLHRLGLVFCDFKPDNVILQGESLKLIDLGGVRRLDDAGGAVYGTVGFQAPEIAEVGPSVASDLFTVARTLAVLILDFKGYQTTYATTLPPPSDQPVLARHESLYRWLLKATAAHPDDRFQTAEEMGDQLLGVLREIVAAEEGTSKPASSTWFSRDSVVPGAAEVADWRQLPTLKVNGDDLSATMLANLPPVAPAQLVELLSSPTLARTVEVDLRLVRAYLDNGDPGGAASVLDRLAEADAWEWRVDWYRGVSALAGGRAADALTAFDRVYGDVPGELAPKLALAMAAEGSNDTDGAVTLYDTVSRTDGAYTAATYGLARCLAARGDRAGAVAAYTRVPPTASAYVDAQVRATRILLNRSAGSVPGPVELAQASATITRLTLDAERRAQLARELLESALALLRDGSVPASPDVVVLGRSLEEPDLRLGLERAYRDLARLAPSTAERISLVDEANRVRPTTLV